MRSRHIDEDRLEELLDAERPVVYSTDEDGEPAFTISFVEQVWAS